MLSRSSSANSLTVLNRLFLILLITALIIVMTVGSVWPSSAFADSGTVLSVESTQVYQGFPINVTAKADGDAWVGIYPTEWMDDPNTFNFNSSSKAEGGNDGYMSVYWYYVKDHYGTSFNIKSGESNVSGSKVSPYKGIPEGEYYVVLFKDGGYTLDKYVKIKVVTNTAGSSELSLKTEGNKRDFGPGEPVNVIATGPDDAWVGLYPASQTIYAGDHPSISWYWVADANGAPYDIKGNTYLSTGKYKIVLFSNSGYDVWGEPIEVTIRDIDTSKTVFTLKLSEGTNYGGGYKENEKILTTVTANGEPGNSWLGIYPGTFDKDTDFSAQRSIYWYYIKDFNGKEIDPTVSATVNHDRIEYFGLPNGDYTIVVFGDGGYNDKRVVVNVRKDKAIKDIVIEKEPTCRTMGKRVIYYEDGTTSEDVDPSSGLIPALGHSWGSYKYDAATKTHHATCSRNTSHTKTEACTFNEGVLTIKITKSAPGKMTYTCRVCGGQYSVDVYPKKGETYTSGKAKYTITGASTVQYIKSNASKTAKTITVPASITLAGKTYKVTSVKSGAFKDQTKAAVKLGKNVKSAPEKVTYKAGSGDTLAGYRIIGTGTVTYYRALASKSAKTLTVPKTVKLGTKTYKVVQISPNAFKGYNKVTKINVGANVKTIKAKAFYGPKKLTTVVIKTTKLTEANVKNSLKGSKIKTLKISLGKAATNKKYTKTYSKIFTKNNAGKAVTLK